MRDLDRRREAVGADALGDVEHEPGRPVAGAVHLGAESPLGHGTQPGVELVEGHRRLAVEVRSVHRIGHVRLEERRGARRRNTVEEDLHEVGSVVGRAELLSARDERLSDRIESEDLVVDQQGRHDPGVQLLRAVEGGQGVEDVGRDPGILERRDAERVQDLDPSPSGVDVLLAGQPAAAVVRLLHRDARSLQQHTGRRSIVGVEHGDSGRGDAVGGDAREFEGTCVRPPVVTRVLDDDDGASDRGLVESLPARRVRKRRQQRRGDDTADDPGIGRQSRRLLSHAVEDLVEGQRRGQREFEELGATGHRVMVVHVDEAGVDRSVTDIQHPCMRPAMSIHLTPAADGEDPPCTHRERLDDRMPVIRRADHLSCDDQVGLGRHHVRQPRRVPARDRPRGGWWRAGGRERRR